MRKLPQLFALAVASLLVLSGCSSNPEKGDADNQLPKIEGDKPQSFGVRA